MPPRLPRPKLLSDGKRCALLCIDLQRGFTMGASPASPPKSAAGDVGEVGEVEQAGEEKEDFFQRTLPNVLKNVAALQRGFRNAGQEVIHTHVEGLTLDGRERSWDYRLSGIHIPLGSPDAAILPEVAPLRGEINLAKGSSDVFVSTNVRYLLRCMDIDHVVICGILTDQCVESSTRTASDSNLYVTQAIDAMTTFSLARHEAALAAVKGYARQLETSDILGEVARRTGESKL